MVLIASRVAYLLANATDPGDMMVCHHCDNPPCVNPAHLFLGTLQDNMDDMTAKGRHAVGSKAAPKNPPRGTRNGNVKLDDSAVREIRTLHATGNFSQRTLAALFEIDRTCIKKILDGTAWKHVV